MKSFKWKRPTGIILFLCGAYFLLSKLAANDGWGLVIESVVFAVCFTGFVLLCLYLIMWE